MKKLSSLFLLLVVSAAIAGPTTKLTWHGHAAFEITTPKGKTLFVDPWLTNPTNPAAKDGKNPVAAIAKADYILLTHGHGDHVGETVELGKKTKARLVAPFELGENMARVLGYPSEQMGYDTLGNPGGQLPIADGEVTVAFVPAVHSSGLTAADGKGPVHYGGIAVGYVIKINGGPTIYHTGDTAYFKDMETIGEQFAPDVALLNIGGHFGMEPAMAAKAAKAVKAKLAIPHHFATFPILTPDAKGFFKELGKIKHREMKAGETLTFDGKNVK